jgi:hypothetical protein
MSILKTAPSLKPGPNLVFNCLLGALEQNQSSYMR